jgi:tRNA nucleotidyltransferase (CCA-adding enzyme)
LAYEDDPLNVVRVLEKEGWLKVLSSHWTTAKVDVDGLSELVHTRQQMNELGYTPDPAAAVLQFLTAKLSDKEISDIRKLVPRKDLVEAWRDIGDHAKELAKRLSGKEAATPSRTWKLLSNARQEMVLYLAVTARQQAVEQKIKNFFTKWREVQQKIPLPEMTELLITPQLPEYPKIAEEVFMLLLDGKLRTRTERMNFLKPLAPPPPPPPPPPRRGRAAKAAAQAAPTAAQPAAGKRGKGQPAPAVAAVAKAPEKAGAVVKPMAKAKVEKQPAKPAAPAKPKAAQKKAPPKKAASKQKQRQKSKKH